jgi:uncharacterized membrane protein YtjA (UPF0391 family)
VLAFLVTALIAVVLDFTGHGNIGHWIGPVGFIGGMACVIIARLTNRR